MFETASYLIISLVMFAYTFTNFTVGGLYSNPLTINQQFLSTPRLIGEKFSEELTAKSVMVVDQMTQTVLWEKDPNQRRAIASLTKLMTALVFLETQPRWDQLIELAASDFQTAGSRYLKKGDQLTTKELFNIGLISSDNVAITALIRSTNLSFDEFIEQMNVKARIFGMTNTEFVDPTGLSFKNQATAIDLSQLAKRAFAEPIIQTVLGLEKYTFLVKPKNISRTIINTNKLLNEEYPKFLLGKTGSTTEAGYCLISKFTTKDSNSIIIILLGSQSEVSRFQETKLLAQWVDNNFEF